MHIELSCRLFGVLRHTISIFLTEHWIVTNLNRRYHFNINSDFEFTVEFYTCTTSYTPADNPFDRCKSNDFIRGPSGHWDSACNI